MLSSTIRDLYGLGLISETSGAGATSYYLADGLGSTTQLTDSAGAVTDSYSYDVFGAPRTVTDTTVDDFRYTGQQRDGNANRGLYFLRARSYDPALGRFLQKDPLPLRNRYAYAGNNAANLTDPTGHCAEPASALAVSGGSAIETGGVGPAVCLAILAGVGCYVTNCGDVVADVVQEIIDGASWLFSKHGGASPKGIRQGMDNNMRISMRILRR